MLFRSVTLKLRETEAVKAVVVTPMIVISRIDNAARLALCDLKFATCGNVRISHRVLGAASTLDSSRITGVLQGEIPAGVSGIYREVIQKL